MEWHWPHRLWAEGLRCWAELSRGGACSVGTWSLRLCPEGLSSVCRLSIWQGEDPEIEGLKREGKSRLRVFPGGKCSWWEVNQGSILPSQTPISMDSSSLGCGMLQWRAGEMASHSHRRCLMGRVPWSNLGHLIYLFQAEEERKKYAFL